MFLAGHRIKNCETSNNQFEVFKTVYSFYESYYNYNKPPTLSLLPLSE